MTVLTERVYEGFDYLVESVPVAERILDRWADLVARSPVVVVKRQRLRDLCKNAFELGRDTGRLESSGMLDPEPVTRRSRGHLRLVSNAS